MGRAVPLLLTCEQVDSSKAIFAHWLPETGHPPSTAGNNKVQGQSQGVSVEVSPTGDCPDVCGHPFVFEHGLRLWQLQLPASWLPHKKNIFVLYVVLPVAEPVP